MQQLDLFSNDIEYWETTANWPAHDRFPYNHNRLTVGKLIEEDLLGSLNPLIITGYTSLDKLIRFLATCHRQADSFEFIRILLGNEPSPSQRQAFRFSYQEFSQEVTDYWLERGISLYLSAEVVLAMELLSRGKVHVQIAGHPRRPIHAKIYKGDSAITLGSSNFSHAGLTWQLEANVRFTETKERTRFNEANQLAECLWSMGKEYTSDLLTLLQQLLRVVSWQDALARACAEVLEGDWAKRYMTVNLLGDKVPLWPAQQQGIAQAMWVMENIGSVLVADATGSGKTRMGAHLIRSVMQRIWGSGRMRRDVPVLTCPPNVQDIWREEAIAAGQPIEIFSHGHLSRVTSHQHELLMRAIRRAQVLAIDEAHSFLNRQSHRARSLLSSMADYVLLFTATPVNRGPTDLLAMIDLLGADNFDEQVLKVLEQVWRRRGPLNETLSSAERNLLRKEIQRFTVRRTKTMLNEKVAQEPERYINRLGNPCRYPDHRTKTYDCHRTTSDQAAAQAIREASQRLRGLVNLRSPLHLSDAQKRDGLSEANYREQRLQGAKGLAKYHVMASLRSSRVALLEHIHGTVATKQSFGLTSMIKPDATGNVLQTLRKMAGRPSQNMLQVALPIWLTDPLEHQRACKEEIATYEHIAALAQNISESRERTKADLLMTLLSQHKVVLAFDSRLLTLYEIRRYVEQHQCCEVVIATGVNPGERQRLKKLLELGSSASGVIALCSDAMAEGINLQAASAVVHLDMPSVIRIAEQRVGRVDRMDSPHPAIEVYWPNDSTAFALRSDELFTQRHRFVSEFLGSNLPLPAYLAPSIEPSDMIVTPQQIIAELEQQGSARTDLNDINDAFELVRSLVTGNQAIVPGDVYERLRASTARVVASVSVVEASKPWAFFAVVGTEWGAPRWVFLDDHDSPILDLEMIGQRLRDVLTPAVVDKALDRHAASLLERFLKQLRKSEDLLLPKKKQRALEEMRIILKQYRVAAERRSDQRRLDVLQQILALVEDTGESAAIDRSTLAECWLDVIRPIWYEHLLQRRRKQPLRLKELRKPLIHEEIETELLREAFSVPMSSRPLDERIVAAIIGVP
jgi:superfamily II DNA or RNA helicase